MSALEFTDAIQAELNHEPVEAEQVIEGAPVATTGVSEIGMLGGNEIGLWEMSAGTMADIEADEYFVVLSGRGEVTVLADNGFSEQTVQLAAGNVVRLHAGMRTRWSVEETLRKVYFTPVGA